MKKIFILALHLFVSISLFAQEDYLPSTITRNNAFSLNFFYNLKNKSDNIAISPYGISNCIAMAYLGSEGKTQESIAKKMNFITPFGILVSYKQLIKRYQIYKSSEINLLIGNALWTANNKEIQKKYKNILKVNFGANVQEISMKEDDENGIKQINRWAKKSSDFNILSFVKQDEIEQTDELIFSNYLFFDGAWESPFNEQLTSKDDFQLPDGSKKKVDFMNQTSYLKYNENDDFQIIELPYSGRNISMIIILPKKENSIDSIEKSLIPVNYDFWTSELYTKLINLSIPKFRIEQTYVIGQYLNDAGLEPIFKNEANFTRISKDPIKISKFIQKTIIQVVENKNSAFTESFGTSNQSNPKDNNFLEFKANRPYIFIIKDNMNKNILLIGKVNNPNFNNLSANYSN